MKAMSQRESRLVAIAILLAVIAVLWLGIVSPILAGFAVRAERRAGLIDSHERNVRIALRAPLFRAQAAEQRQSSGDWAIVAPDAEAAADMLRSRTRAAVERHGAVIKAVQEVPGQAGWVAVRIDAELSLAQLTAILGELESGLPHLVVETLSVSADKAFQTGRLEPMDIRIEIAAPHLPAAQLPAAKR